MSNKLYEKFTWLKQDLIYAGPKGNKAQFKGIALLPTISGNGRKYVEEELHRSARTLVGKPLTLNHNSTKVLGDVTWAEFENGCIEYVAETKNPEYIEKLKDCKRLAKEAYVKKWGRDPIYGVSVEANYRFHDQQCVGGHCTIEPHGIIFNALSLVEDPEQPGVGGTTVELMETLNVEKRLSEMIVHDLVPVEHQSSVLTESKVTEMVNSKDEKGKMEGNDCPVGQHKNEAGECVPDDYSEEILDLKHQIEKANLKVAREFKILTETVAKAKTEFATRIGEVDTVQKNCCERQGETQRQLLDTEAIAKGVLEKVQVLETLKETYALKTDIKPPVDFDSLINPLKETISKFETLIAESIKPIKESVSKLETQIAESDKKYGTLNLVYEALNKKYEGFVKETAATKLKETQDAQLKLQEVQGQLSEKEKSLKEMQEQIDTLKLHVNPNFKAKQQELPQKDANFNAPYTYTK